MCTNGPKWTCGSTVVDLLVDLWVHLCTLLRTPRPSLCTNWKWNGELSKLTIKLNLLFTLVSSNQTSWVVLSWYVNLHVGQDKSWDNVFDWRVVDSRLRIVSCNGQPKGFADVWENPPIWCHTQHKMNVTKTLHLLTDQPFTPLGYSESVTVQNEIEYLKIYQTNTNHYKSTMYSKATQIKKGLKENQTKKCLFVFCFYTKPRLGINECVNIKLDWRHETVARSQVLARSAGNNIWRSLGGLEGNIKGCCIYPPTGSSCSNAPPPPPLCYAHQSSLNTVLWSDRIKPTGLNYTFSYDPVTHHYEQFSTENHAASVIWLGINYAGGTHWK